MEYRGYISHLNYTYEKITRSNESLAVVRARMSSEGEKITTLWHSAEWHKDSDMGHRWPMMTNDDVNLNVIFRRAVLGWREGGVWQLRSLVGWRRRSTWGICTSICICICVFWWGMVHKVLREICHILRKKIITNLIRWKHCKNCECCPMSLSIVSSSQKPALQHFMCVAMCCYVLDLMFLVR